MAENSGISWTDHTFNPWIGCQKVSPLCDNCYAEALDKTRLGGGHWGPGAPRRRTKTWGDPLRWNRAALASGVSARVFMASLADFLDNAVPDEWRNEAWEIVRECQSLDWLIVTKRIGNLPEMLPPRYRPEDFRHVTIISSMGLQKEIDRDGPKLENARYLFQFPRIGVSCEPMLEPITLGNLRPDWVICGAESGSNRRPFEIAWMEKLHAECLTLGIPFFAKQDSAFRAGVKGRIPDYIWDNKQLPRFR